MELHHSSTSRETYWPAPDHRISSRALRIQPSGLCIGQPQLHQTLDWRKRNDISVMASCALAVPQQRQLFVLGPSSSSALPRPRQQLFHPLPSFSCCCWSRRRLASCSATSCSPACANAFLLEGLALLPRHPLLDPSAPRSPQFCDAAPASNHVCHGAFTQEIIQRGRSMIIAETSFIYHRIPMPRCIYKV